LQLLLILIIIRIYVTKEINKLILAVILFNAGNSE